MELVVMESLTLSGIGNESEENNFSSKAHVTITSDTMWTAGTLPVGQ